MARTTGPVLAIGGITMANAVIFNNQPIDWRIPIATGISAMLLALAEKGWELGAVSLAWTALVTILFVRLDGRTPSPMESAATWWSKTEKSGGAAPETVTV
jgi:uncharacterized membrane protein